MRTAILFGATGLVGAAILEQLLANPRYEKVVVVSRRPTGRAQERLVEVVVELDRLESVAAQLSGDDVFIALGTTIKKAGSKDAFKKVDFDYVVSAAKVTAQKGAQRLAVVTAIGASSRSMVFYNKVKGQTEEAVRTLPFAAIHIFRPSLLLGARPESRTGEKFASVALGVVGGLMIGPLEKYRGISGSDVAEAMIRVCGEERPGVHIYESDEIQRLAHLSRVGVQQRPS